MNNYYLYIFISLLCILYLKWILFAFMSFPIRLFYKKLSRRNVQKTSERNNNPKYDCIIKRIVLRYLSGYIRWMDYEVARIPSHAIRYFVYRNIFCVRMAKKVTIYHGAEIRSPYRLEIGRGSIVGDNAILDARNGLKIGRNVNISSNVSIYTMQHDHRSPTFSIPYRDDFGVTIGDRVWLGPNSVILHSIHIGEGAVVAAGAVVTKDVPPYSIVAGIPAKIIGTRTTNLVYEFDGKYIPFI